MAARGDHPVANVNINVIPVSEVRNDLLVGHGISGAEVFERLVGKDYTPAEGVLSPIPFEDSDVVVGIGALQEQRQIKTCRAPADDRDLHDFYGPEQDKSANCFRLKIFIVWPKAFTSYKLACMKRSTVLLVALLAVAGWAKKPELRDQAIQQLIAAENAFAHMSVEQGIRASFLANFADDGINFTPHPQKTRATLSAAPPPAQKPPVTLDWHPVKTDAAKSGELGY